MKKIDVLNIIEETIKDIQKEYKYTENEWEEGAKVTSLRFMNEIKEKVEKLT